MKNTTWKWIALGAMVLWSIILVSGGIKKGLDIEGGTSIEVEIDEPLFRTQYAEANPDKKPAELNAEFNQAMDGARRNLPEIIRNRIDRMGIEEPSIYLRGGNRLVVQLPGITSNKQAQARETIKNVATLQFRLVSEQSAQWVKALFEQKLAPRGYKIVQIDAQNSAYIPENAKVKDAINADELRRFQPRPRSEFMLMKKVLRDGSQVYEPHYVESRIQLDGTQLAKAYPNQDMNNRIIIDFKLKKVGAEKFARLTSDFCTNGERNSGREGRQLAIVLDGTLYSAPVIKSPITGGSGMIEGQFDYTEALRLSTVLMSGALPAPVKIMSESTVSPTAGKSAVSSGVNAAIIGSVGVILFMALYYRLAGMVQNMALVLIVVLIPFGAWIAAGFLGMISSGGVASGKVPLPTITLPGIAGIALTIGMAVDAAVLIFERMREELAAGKSLRASIEAGYERAFSAIFDSNVTTVISAVILFWQGTGPVRGFAVMLTAGIIVSMIVYLIYMRLFLETVAEKGHIKTFKFLHVIKSANFDFLGKTRIAVIVTVIVLGIAGGMSFAKGKKAFNVEFLGGAEIVFSGLDSGKTPSSQIEDLLRKSGVTDAFVQYEGDRLSVRVPVEEGEKATAIVLGAYEAQGAHAGETNLIGAQVGRELARSGALALLMAVLGIAAYLTFRFEFAFAVGAIVSLLHDALITIFVFSALGHQFSLAFVSALLAMIGYSTNDTVIVFDRIREERKLQAGKMTFREICNHAINLTLSRTVITHAVTLISVTALWLIGTGVIKDIAFTMFVGIVTGTFSSIFIATPIMMLWHRSKKPAGTVAAPAKAKA